MGRVGKKGGGGIGTAEARVFSVPVVSMAGADVVAGTITVVLPDE